MRDGDVQRFHGYTDAPTGRLAEIDQKAGANYQRLLREQMGQEAFQYRYTSKRMQGIYEGAGRIDRPTFMTDSRFESNAQSMDKAQVAEDWGRHEVGMKIPTSEVMDARVPRPFGNSPHVRQGWEPHTNSYPEYGSGGALQFLGRTERYDPAWAYDLTNDFGKAKPAEAVPAASAPVAEAADLGLSGRGYRPQPGERSMPRAQWQLEQSEVRARNSVANTDLPLENPLPNAAARGHGHEYHGYQTTDAQQAERVHSGTTPDGLPGRPPPQASRFSSAKSEAEALRRGRRELNERLAASQVPSHPDPATGAATYVNPVNGAPVRESMVVPTNRPGGYGPGQLPQRDPATNQIVRDANGQRVPLADPAPRPNANVVWEYAPSASEWRPLTYYPEP